MKTRSRGRVSETSKRCKVETPKIQSSPEVIEEIEIGDDSDSSDGNDSDNLESSADFTETDPTLISTLVKEHCIFCLTRKTRTIFSISNTAEVTDGHELLSHYFGSGTADSLNDIFDAAVFTNKRLLTSEFPAPLMCEGCVQIFRELDSFHKKLELLQRQILLRIRKVRQHILNNGSSIKSDEEPSDSRLQFENDLLENCHGNEETTEMVLSILDKFQEVFNADTSDKIEIHLEYLEKVASFAAEQDTDVSDCQPSTSTKTVSVSSQTDNNIGIEHYHVKILNVSVDNDEEDEPNLVATHPTSLAQCSNADNTDALVKDLNTIEDLKPVIPTTISNSTQTDNDFEDYVNSTKVDKGEDNLADNLSSPVCFDDDDNDFNYDGESPGSPQEIIESAENIESDLNSATQPASADGRSISPTPENVNQNPTVHESINPPPPPIEPMSQNVTNSSSSIVNRPVQQNVLSGSIIAISSTNDEVSENTTAPTVHQAGNGIRIVRNERANFSTVTITKAEINSGVGTHGASENNCDEDSFRSGEKIYTTQQSQKKRNKKKPTRDESESSSDENEDKCQVSSAESEDGDRRKEDKTTTTTTKPFKCSLCKQGFLRRYDVYRHIRNIHNTEPVLDRPAAVLQACTECDFKTNKTVKLKDHMTKVHQLKNHLRTYECDVCGYSKDGLKLNEFLDHLRKHEGLRKSKSCEDCLQKFTTKQMYQMHPCPQTGRLPGTGTVVINNFDNIRKGNEYKCRFCTDLVKFHSEKSLQTHFLSLHKQSKPFLCEICGGDTDFKSRNCLKTHMIETHDAVKFKCRICEEGTQEFKRYEELHLHMGLKHFGGHYTCPDCSKTFTEIKSLEEHALIHETSADNEKPEKIYMCEFCALPFRSAKGLRSHKAREHSGIETDSEPKLDANGQPVLKYPRLSPSRPATYVPRKNGQAKPFTCSLCDYDCCTAFLHRRHMQIDHGILLEKKFKTRTYECETCDYTSNVVRVRGFVMHLQEHENSTKKFCCEDCFQFFTTKQMYQYHSCPQTGKLPGTATIHVEGFDINQKEQYTCKTCGKVFGGEKALQNHSLKEHTQNAFFCDLCELGTGNENAAFASKDILKTHRITVHGAVPYKCRLCAPPKNFTKFHDIFTHTNTVHFECFYECPHCPKKFAERLKLENHMSTHSKAKTHICKFCGSGLKSIGTLRRHIKIHHAEGGVQKQHVCEYCSKAFSEKSNMTKHIQIHLREQGRERPTPKRSPRPKRTASRQ